MYTIFLIAALSMAMTNPEHSQSEVEFKVDLEFGGGEDERMFWPALNTSVQVDNEGHIFVCDPSANKVHRFDENGSWIISYGGRGEGPGEFSNLSSFQILADNTRVAFEVAPGVLPKLTFYDADMNFVERKMTGQISMIPTSATFSPDGKLIAGTYISLDPNKQVMVSSSGLLDRNYKIIQECTRNEQDYQQMKMMDPAYLKKFIAQTIEGLFKPTCVFAFANDGKIFIARSDRYQIDIWDSKLETKIRSIEKKYTPRPFSDANRDRLVDIHISAWRQAPGIGDMITGPFITQAVGSAELPHTENPIHGLIVSEDGSLLVVTELDMVTGTQKVDWFSPDGKWLAKSELNNWAFLNSAKQSRMVFRNGFAYCLTTDANEVNRVVRYSYGGN